MCMWVSVCARARECVGGVCVCVCVWLCWLVGVYMCEQLLQSVILSVVICGLLITVRSIQCL